MDSIAKHLELATTWGLSGSFAACMCWGGAPDVLQVLIINSVNGLCRCVRQLRTYVALPHTNTHTPSLLQVHHSRVTPLTPSPWRPGCSGPDPWHTHLVCGCSTWSLPPRGVQGTVRVSVLAACPTTHAHSQAELGQGSAHIHARAHWACFDRRGMWNVKVRHVWQRQK